MPASSTLILRWNIHRILGLLLACSLLPPATGVKASDAAPDLDHSAETQAAQEEMLFQVDINRQQLNETVMLIKDANLGFLVSGDDLHRWRLRLPSIAPINYQGQAFYPLQSVKGLRYTVNAAALTLQIEVPPEEFMPTVAAAEKSSLPQLTRASLGGFANYDFFWERSSEETVRSGLFEFGIFNRHGVGIVNFLADRLGNNPHFIRLDTTWTIDQPETLTSLRLGDTISTPATTWGRSVRFGGIQYSTNFGTQPTLVTFPLQSVSGTAVVPSSVDVYVDNALSSRRDVPAGPFSITDLPLVTGKGELRVVVRDLLGREQVITTPFYATATLLKKGLSDFSYDFGFVRENFGIEDNDYGRALASINYRKGLSDYLTGEIHAEALSGGPKVLGVGAVVLKPDWGEFSASIAASNNDGKDGYLAAIGFDRQTKTLSFGANSQWTSEHFSQIGLDEGRLAARNQSIFNVGYATKAYGSFGVAYVLQDNRDEERIELVSASYNYTISKLGTFSISALEALSGETNRAITFALTIPLDARTSFSAVRSNNVSGDNRNDRFETVLQRNLPVGQGMGYRLRVDDAGAREADISLQTNVATVTAAMADFEGQTATRFSAAGGVAVLDGRAFFSRRISESFAVVKVPDYSGIRVYDDNQLAGRTDSRGYALLPNLRPYDKNQIAIEQLDLPLDAQVDTLELEAAPYFRSGMLLEFPVKRSRGALLKIVLDDHQPMPTGAEVQVDNYPEKFPVAEDGEVYVTGLQERSDLRAIWRDQSCEFAVNFPATDDPLPNLGTYLCEGVKP